LATFNAAEMGPIGERGWTVQENMLSNRMVHFTKIALFWECQQTVISENGHPVLQNAGDVSLIRQFQQEFKWDFALSWHTFVEMYSLRKLTFTKDQLPAIAGIAFRLHSRSGFKYRAGLWEEIIGLNLTWTVPSDAFESATILAGPSWSWTSIGSPVQFPDGLWAHNKVLCHIEENSGCSISKTSFLAAGEHNLRLNGPLQEAVLTSRPAESVSEAEASSMKSKYVISLSDSKVIGFHKLLLTFLPDTRLKAVTTNRNSGSVQIVQRSAEMSTPFHANVFCLWCVQQPPDDGSRDFESKIIGVILERTGRDTYSRLGAVSLLGSPDCTDRFEKYRKTISLI